MLTKTGLMGKNLFPPWGKGAGVLEYAKQIVFWDKGKGNNTYKGLLNYWITLKQHELDKAQEQARPSSIHAYEVDSVLSKCHMLPIPPKKTVCAQKHY